MEMVMDKEEMKKSHRQKTAMPLLWIGIVSILMLFASLTSAVIVSMGSKEWMTFEMPITFLFSTIVILLSSFTYWLGYKSARKNKTQELKSYVLITLLLGISFGVLQFVAWGQLVDQNIHFAGAGAKVSGSYLYALTGIHLAHLIGGLVSLVVVYIKSNRSKYNSENLLGLQLSSTYWHFLGGLWLYLYLFLNFIAL